MGISDASVVVFDISKEWLGTVGSILAILGVVAAPITSGDTAFRSARLIVADFLNFEQKSMKSRLYICVPCSSLPADYFCTAYGMPTDFRSSGDILHGPIRPWPYSPCGQ